MGAGSYQGVILAAGHGSRMGPFGEMFPKPVVPVCNKPLMAYQLDYLRDVGIEEVFIVIGHLGHRITQALGDGSAWGVRIQYVEQQQRLGIAHALGQLERRIDRPFLLMLGDMFFDMGDLAVMLRTMEAHNATAVLGVIDETDPEAVKRNYSILLREDGTVRRVIEKPRHVTVMQRGCGLYLFDLPIFDAIRRTPRTAMRDEYEITDSIQILIDYEYPVRVATAVDWDMNITYIGDLIACCRRQLRRMGRDNLVGADCQLVEGVELSESVLGDRVTVRHPVRLERCVVLNDVVLEQKRPYRDMVITREGALKTGWDA